MPLIENGQVDDEVQKVNQINIGNMSKDNTQK